MLLLKTFQLTEWYWELIVNIPQFSLTLNNNGINDSLPVF